MPLIHLTTFISAPADRVFDLSRSIDLHKASMKTYLEQPINGRITGLIEAGETVTWKAKHLFKERVLEVRVTKMERPHFFIDEQVKGDFISMKHEHYCKTIENGTLLIDQFHYVLPWGGLGALAGRIYVNGYLERLLTERNSYIKKVAEGNQWKNYLEK